MNADERQAVVLGQVLWLLQQGPFRIPKVSVPAKETRNSWTVMYDRLEGSVYAEDLDWYDTPVNKADCRAYAQGVNDKDEAREQRKPREARAVPGRRWFGGDGLGGFHCGAMGCSGEAPDVFHVPVVETSDDGETLAAENDGGVGDCGYSCSGEAGCACVPAFGDGTGAQGVENYGGGERDQVCAKAEALGTIGLGRRGLGVCCWFGFHWGAGGLPGHAPGVSEVPFVEAVNGREATAAEADGGSEAHAR